MEKMNQKQKVFECDLHCHTNRSDGNLPLKDVIDMAVSRGVKVLAVTDHDVIPAEYVMTEKGRVKTKDYAAKKKICVIPGIEVSCDTYVDDVHMIGLDCDWNHPFFKELQEMVVAGKMECNRKLVEVLQKDGFSISWDEVLYNEGSPVKPENVQKKKIFELLARKGYVRTWQDAKLMVQNNPEYNIRREKPDPVKVISKIHEAGGITILAHPYLIRSQIEKNGRRMDRFTYIDRLVDAGLDGIEGNYTYDKTSYAGNLTKEEIERQVRERYEGRLSFISGGSDYHADEVKGVKNARMQGECGISLAYFDQHIRGFLKSFKERGIDQ